MINLWRLPGERIGHGRLDTARQFSTTVDEPSVDRRKHAPTAAEQLRAATELLAPEVVDQLCYDELPQGLGHVRDEAIRIGFELEIPTS